MNKQLLASSPNGFQRLFLKFAASRAGAWILAPIAGPIDRAMFRWSGGRTALGLWLTGLPVVNVNTIGAKSGLRRSVPLLGIPDGDKVILIASSWGRSSAPDWSYNLRANPEASLTAKGQTAEYVAREVFGEEKETCWRKAMALYAGFDGYKERAGREIPVFVLEPRPVE